MGERTPVTAHGRVGHAVGTAMPVWLVVVPRVHTRSRTHLGSGALDELGPLLQLDADAMEPVSAQPVRALARLP